MFENQAGEANVVMINSLDSHSLLSTGGRRHLLNDCKSFSLTDSFTSQMPMSCGQVMAPTTGQIFAKYCLPIEDVQRWLSDQSELTSSRRCCRTHSAMSTSTSTSNVPPVQQLYDAKRQSALNHDENWSMIALADLASSSPPVMHSSSLQEQTARQNERLLVDLEARARDWARQASAMRDDSRKLRGIEEVDHNKLKNIEKILLDAVAEMQRSHTLPHQGHQISTGMSATPPKTNTRDDIIRVQNQNEASTKRGRRQNHKNEQKNVLMAWFAQHELDPYPNNDEKFALARASGLEVRQVEHWFTNRRKRYWRAQANQLAEQRPLAEQAFAERGLSYSAIASTVLPVPQVPVVYHTSV